MVAHFHEGTSYAAADFHRKWFTHHWPINKADSWLYHEDAWQSTIINYPDDTILYRFDDLPRLARNAKTYGINVIQIDGWDVGGIDRGFPIYQPDPRLGTRDDFVQAVEACQQEGVRFLLFANVQSVNTETDIFRQELYKDVVRDAYDNIASMVGWGYHTCLGYLGPAAPSPTTTGKIERFHRSLRIEFNTRQVFRNLKTAQEALDEWVTYYNTQRPHQSLADFTPESRFRSEVGREQRQLHRPERNGEQWVSRRVARNGIVCVDSQHVSVGKNYSFSSGLAMTS